LEVQVSTGYDSVFIEVVMSMSTDIFADWKSNRFVLVDFGLLGKPDLLVVLTDLNFWTNNTDKLLEWCGVYGARVKGMTVEFDNTEQLTMFCLRWS
jgi:hypothetical protein